jgi:hypothetical protein
MLEGTMLEATMLELKLNYEIILYPYLPE